MSNISILEERLKELNVAILRYESYPDVQDYLDLLNERDSIIKKINKQRSLNED